jgi:hypothetical protein
VTQAASVPDWPALLSRAEALLAGAAPELAAVPLYFVTASGTLFVDALVSGLTHPDLDRWLRADIGARWQGRGIAVLFNDGAEGVAGTVPPVLWAQHVACLAVHEVGHAVADRWGVTRAEAPEPSPQALALEKRVLPLAAADLAEGELSPEGWASEFLGHGLDWIRAVLHLRRRIGARGTYLPASVCIGRRGWLSLAETYDGALGDEPEQLAERPLAEILDSPPPPPFAELWEADRAEFETYYAEQPT